ncbi:MAG: nickel-responsive transcriptional regulator NikR [Pyrinomonadaceae bacterium]
MSNLSRFGVSAEDELLESFDRLLTDQGYATRSEALRDLMRDALVKSHLDVQPKTAEVVGSLTLVYDHHASELNERMAAIQHDHHGLVISVLHVHVSHDDCMEVIVLRGHYPQVTALANALLSLKGVKHGKLFVTLPANTIAQRPHDKVHTHRHTHATPHPHRHSE